MQSFSFSVSSHTPARTKQRRIPGHVRPDVSDHILRLIRTELDTVAARLRRRPDDALYVTDLSAAPRPLPVLLLSLDRQRPTGLGLVRLGRDARPVAEAAIGDPKTWARLAPVLPYADRSTGWVGLPRSALNDAVKMARLVLHLKGFEPKRPAAS